jgi:hypothetical protein
MIARFKVGDQVWIKQSGPWKVIGRYWVRSKGHIAYDLEFANGAVLPRVPDDEVFMTCQHLGFMDKDRV